MGAWMHKECRVAPGGDPCEMAGPLPPAATQRPHLCHLFTARKCPGRLTDAEGDKGGDEWVAHAVRRVGGSSQVGLQLLLAARTMGTKT